MTLAGETTTRLVLSIDEVAHALGISDRFAKTLIYSGQLPSFKLGRLRRVYVRDLQQWIEERRVDNGLDDGTR